MARVTGRMVAAAVGGALVMGLAGFAIGTATASQGGREEGADRARTAACRTWETGLVQSGARSAAHAVQEAAEQASAVPAPQQEREFLGGISGPEHAFDELREGAVLAREAALVPDLSQRDHQALADLSRGLELMRAAAVVGDHPEDEGVELLTITDLAGPQVRDSLAWVDRNCRSS